MDRSIPMLLIGLVFGGGIGFVIAASQGVTLDGHDHADPAHHGAEATAAIASDGIALKPGDLCTADNPQGASVHDHDTPHLVSGGPSAPTLDVEAFRDPDTGWNLQIRTSNFRFAPENASRSHVPGEGHAHVYINGVKLGRYYGEWLHLGGLPDGDVTVEVTLTANDHRPIAIDGIKLKRTLTLEN